MKLFKGGFIVTLLSLSSTAFGHDMQHKHSNTFEFDFAELSTRMPVTFQPYGDLTDGDVDGANFETIVKTTSMQPLPPPTRHQHIARLVGDLLGPTSDYNRTVLPTSLDDTGPFVVFCRLYLIRVQEVIENDETFVTTLRLQLSWNDSALRWDPDKYGGLREIILPPESIWNPDLQIANSVDDIISLVHNDDFRFRVTHEGRVWYHPSGRFSTRCKLDLRLYPFDYQRCSIVVESVTYTSNELVIHTRPDKNDAVALGMYSQNPMWSLIDADGFAAIYKTGRKTGFSRVQFYVIVQRKPGYFINAYLVPLVLLSILQVLTYLMPIKFVDRVPQATVVLLTAFFFQGQLAEQLPRTSENESFVQSYLNLMLGLSVMTVSICVLTLECIDPDDGLPLWGFPQLYKIHRARKKGRRSAVVEVPPDFAERMLRHSLEVDSPENTPVSTFVYNQHRLSHSLRRNLSVHRQTRGYSGSRTTMRSSVDGGDDSLVIDRKTIVAALLNWLGFVVTLAVSVIHPAMALLAFASSEQPEMPRATADNITTSYYAEY